MEGKPLGGPSLLNRNDAQGEYPTLLREDVQNA